jgi:hypothetical protein
MIREISRKMLDEMDADLEDDALHVGMALTEAFKAGIRVGAAEVIGSVTDQAKGQGVTFDLHFHLVDASDDE